MLRLYYSSEAGRSAYQEMVLYPQLPSRGGMPRGSHMGKHWGWAGVGRGGNVGRCLSGGFCEKEQGERVSSLRIGQFESFQRALGQGDCP